MNGQTRHHRKVFPPTFFSKGRRRENFPKRTWNGEQARDPIESALIYIISRNIPSSCSTTTTSIAPLSVAGLIEFQVFETDPLKLRTYCMAQCLVRLPAQRVRRRLRAMLAGEEEEEEGEEEGEMMVVKHKRNAEGTSNEVKD